MPVKVKEQLVATEVAEERSSRISSSDHRPQRRPSYSRTARRLKPPSWQIVFLQMVFWPLTLGWVVACRVCMTLQKQLASRPLNTCAPQPLLIRLLAAPFYWANPLVVLGGAHVTTLVRQRNTHRSSVTTHAQTISTVVSAPSTPSSVSSTQRLQVPQCPVLLVGNQSINGYGHLPLLNEVMKLTGSCPRELYDQRFSYVPCWGMFAEMIGGVSASQRKYAELAKIGAWELFYPGGTQEAASNNNSSSNSGSTELAWNETLGFMRAAIKHEAVIVPFATLGLADSLWLAEGPDLSAIFPAPHSKHRDPTLAGIRFSVPLWNTRQRQYIAFGEPIHTAKYLGDWESTAKCTELYTAVKGDVQKLIGDLKRLQAADPNRFFWRRHMRRVLAAVRIIKHYDAAVIEADEQIRTCFMRAPQ